MEIAPLFTETIHHEAERSPGLMAGDSFAGQAVFGRLGTLEVRLARSDAEIAAAQRLRRQVFFGSASSQDLDVDAFDENCDHLIVVDQDALRERIVGTYRLLRQDRAQHSGFYSEAEFELGRLVARHPGLRFLELGRSCVLPEYRTKRTIELLWQGIHAYLTRHRVDVMIGCASFPGVDPADHAHALSYLAHHCVASGPWAVRAVGSRYCNMDMMPPEAVDTRAAMAGMPPLVKAYLRVGAKIGEGCVIDAEFNTVDVFIVMPVKAIAPRYLNYYGGDARLVA